jgi:adenylate kinase
MAAGNLVSDDVMIGIVRERLNRDDARHGFVLDGFPRTVSQAAELDRIMGGRGPLVVVNLDVPDDVLVRRLGMRRICSRCGTTAAIEWIGACRNCGGALITRPDDTIETVRERLKVYNTQTKPLVDYYSKRATFKSIDGNQPPDAVAALVDEAIMDVSRSVAL